jgi:hypothetical protein
MVEEVSGLGSGDEESRRLKEELAIDNKKSVLYLRFGADAFVRSIH